nr:MAG TPA: hypothetical protein [Caudoviricetes sp.]DAX41578.1 MAG TPA: hypothetical protein [Caudoviricetes sp.]DAY35572.1 MAG TPA: hypothetical protein [Caudoviricetes sp.]
MIYIRTRQFKSCLFLLQKGGGSIEIKCKAEVFL